MSSKDMRAEADRISAAADTITQLNTSNGHGLDLAWKSRDLHSHAFALRIEADELDNEEIVSPAAWADADCSHCNGTGYINYGPEVGTDLCRCTDGPDCIHCGAPEFARHHHTCRHGADE